MKKLLLILLCFPLIGFGQIWNFQTGTNFLLLPNSSYTLSGGSHDVNTRLGVNSKGSYLLCLNDMIHYVPSVSYNLVSFRNVRSSYHYIDSELHFLNIGHEFSFSINNKIEISTGVSLDLLLLDKGHLYVDWSQLTFGDMIDPQRGFVYPTTTDPNIIIDSDYATTEDLGYYISFLSSFKYTLIENSQSRYFVFTDIRIPFFYSNQPEKSTLPNANNNSLKYLERLNLQFDRYVSLGIGVTYKFGKAKNKKGFNLCNGRNNSIKYIESDNTEDSDLNNININIDNSVNIDIDIELDIDKDGVPNKNDTCPYTKGPIENNGCPIITEQQKAIIDTAFKHLEFVMGKANITFSSYSSLELLGRMLADNSEMSLKISGHTDNIGDDAANMELSRLRAEAVKTFLTSRGIESSRITTFYYGENRSIAPNDTEKGRAKNRRVELAIFFE